MTETVPGPEPAGGLLSRWLKPLLVVSLAINIMIAAAFATSVLHSRQHGRVYHPGSSGRGGEEMSLMSFARTLEPERASALRKVLRAEKPDFKALWADKRRARREAAAVLAADTYDREQLASAFSRIDEAETKLKSTARSMILRIVDTLTPEERKALSIWWQEHKPHLFRDDVARPGRKEKKDEERSGKSAP